MNWYDLSRSGNLSSTDRQATVLMCAIVAFSFYWIRRQQYELFLIAHIVLSILVLVTMAGYASRHCVLRLPY